MLDKDKIKQIEDEINKQSKEYKKELDYQFKHYLVFGEYLDLDYIRNNILNGKEKGRNKRDSN